MGSLTLTAVLPVRPGTVDDAREIGALTILPQTTAMQTALRASDGALVYVKEIPIFAGCQWRAADYGDRARHRWWRFEVKVCRNSEATSAIQPGHCLVIAMHPYSTKWMQQAAFKPAFKKERPVLGSVDTSEALITWIEKECPYDFWEKGNYLTAGISEPELPFKSLADVRNGHGTAKWLFGVCDDFAACVDALWASKKVNNLLERTEKGTLRFWPAKVNLPFRPQRWDPKRSDEVEVESQSCVLTTEEIGQTLSLYDKLKAESRTLMSISICQALAGPRPREKKEQWENRLVVDNVKQIYCSHLFTRWQQITRDVA